VLFRSIVGGGPAQAVPPTRHDEIGKEHQVKAAFLMAIPKFVAWPDHAAVEQGDTLRIGVIHSKLLLQALRDLPGKEVKGKTIAVVEAIDFQAGLGVDVLFVGQGARAAFDNEDELRTAISSLSEAPVLIICEDEDFVNMGGAVNFYLDRGKVRIEIRNGAAKNHGLALGARLLQIARLVD